MPDWEFIDLYDANRKPLGLTIQREGAHLEPGQYMLYAYALLENPEGKFLITQRALDKHWAPGSWEVSGGGALSGETTLDAIKREVGEETGLDISDVNAKPVYSYVNVDAQRGDNYFADIYHLHVDFCADDIVLQQSEAIDFKLASWDEIAALNAEGRFLHFKRLQEALDAEKPARQSTAGAFAIRHSTSNDLERMLAIYEHARAFMAEHGNPRQWGLRGWPPKTLIEQDIAKKKSYVCEHDGRIVGTFFFDFGSHVESTYEVIHDGAWSNPEAPYGVVHRIASDSSVKGVGTACLRWAYEQCGSLRIDTHSDNVVMQNLLQKEGFKHCGTIYVTEDEFPRLAYEKLPQS